MFKYPKHTLPTDLCYSCNFINPGTGFLKVSHTFKPEEGSFPYRNMYRQKIQIN